MTNHTAAELVEAMRSALEGRRYDEFVDHFAEDGSYELPFALPGTPNSFVGISAIRARFKAIAQAPTTKLLDVQSVTASFIQSVDPNVVVVELSTTGRATTSGEAFTLSSSIAVIHCDNGKVKRYRDYPNTLAIAKAAGVLSQLAATLK